MDFVIRYKGECTLVEVKAATGNAKSTKTILRHPEKYHESSVVKLGDYNVGRTDSDTSVIYGIFIEGVLSRRLAILSVYHIKALVVILYDCKYNGYVKGHLFTERGIIMGNPRVAPFVKWAGGKRQLLSQIKERMPEIYNNYYEPFVGGGAVTFELLPANALINDINKALINAYRQICEAPETFLKAVNKFDEEMWEDGRKYYYFIREHYNDKLMKAEYDVELAALFVFINKHCFNGLYRVNGKGLFNVPYNNSRRASVDKKAIMEVSEYLKGVTIIDGDFEVACKDAKKGDFLFLDSPYAPLNPTSFESYTKEGFDIESHKRLANLFDELTARGCYCMLTNHNTDLINKLYGNKGYNIDVVSVRRMINSDASGRVGEEVIICNY